jgi:hypothetical protein
MKGIIMAKREQFHQFDPVRMAPKKFEELEFRDEVKGEKYQEGVAYRDKNYPGTVFYWKAYDADHHKKMKATIDRALKTAEVNDEKGKRLTEVPLQKTKGEWHMGAVDLGDDEE